MSNWQNFMDRIARSYPNLVHFFFSQMFKSVFINLDRIPAYKYQYLTHRFYLPTTGYVYFCLDLIMVVFITSLKFHPQRRKVMKPSN